MKTKHSLALCGALAISTFSASAASTSFSLFDFTGDDTQINVTVEEMGSDLKFTLDLISAPGGPVSGDISALFAHIDNEALIPGLSVMGPNVTGSHFEANNVTNQLGGGTATTPFNQFDIGVKIGGNGDDDIESTMFTLKHSSVDLKLADFQGQQFGGRIKSSGPNEGGSSKLRGTFRQTPTPSGPRPPRREVASTGSTAAFLLISLGLLEGFRRRFSAKA